MAARAKYMISNRAIRRVCRGGPQGTFLRKLPLWQGGTTNALEKKTDISVMKANISLKSDFKLCSKYICSATSNIYFKVFFIEK